VNDKKYLYQAGIIFLFTFLGETLAKIIPFPIPAAVRKKAAGKLESVSAQTASRGLLPAYRRNRKMSCAHRHQGLQQKQRRLYIAF